MQVKVAVLVEDAEGNRNFFFTVVPEVTEEEYANGEHYDWAKSAAEDLGYRVFEAFDQNDGAVQALTEMARFFEAE